MHLPEGRTAVLVADRHHEIGFWYHLLRFREEAASVTVIALQPDHEYRSEFGYPVTDGRPITARSADDLPAYFQAPTAALAAAQA